MWPLPGIEPERPELPSAAGSTPASARHASPEMASLGGEADIRVVSVAMGVKPPTPGRRRRNRLPLSGREAGPAHDQAPGDAPDIAAGGTA